MLGPSSRHSLPENMLAFPSTWSVTSRYRKLRGADVKSAWPAALCPPRNHPRQRVTQNAHEPLQDSTTARRDSRPAVPSKLRSRPGSKWGVRCEPESPTDVLLMSACCDRKRCMPLVYPCCLALDALARPERRRHTGIPCTSLAPMPQSHMNPLEEALANVSHSHLP